MRARMQASVRVACRTEHDRRPRAARAPQAPPGLRLARGVLRRLAPRPGPTRRPTCCGAPTATVLAKPPQLSLALLGPHAYADGTQVLADDVIGDTTRDYAAHAAALHRNAAYNDRVYGHARRDKQGRLWLQYWLFYYYNDFQLLGPLRRRQARGRLGARADPARRRRAARAGGLLPAQDRREQAVGRRPEGRGATRRSSTSPAARTRTTSAPGSHWTGTWFDQADGKGPQIAPTLEVARRRRSPRGCTGPASWGDTKATSSPLDSSSPISPGRRPHWLDPSALSRAPSSARPHRAPPAAADQAALAARRPVVVDLRGRARRDRARRRHAPRRLRRARAHPRLRARPRQRRGRGPRGARRRRLGERRRGGRRRLRGREGRRRIRERRRRPKADAVRSQGSR